MMERCPSKTLLLCCCCPACDLQLQSMFPTTVAAELLKDVLCRTSQLSNLDQTLVGLPKCDTIKLHPCCWDFILPQSKLQMRAQQPTTC